MLARVVLDTDVIVAAFRSRLGASRALLIQALDGRFLPLVSTALWLEYESVLTRPAQLEAMKLNASEVRNVLLALSSVAEPVSIHFRWRPVAADSADEHILELALNGRADLLVTFNRNDFDDASKLFQVEVLSPAEALRWLP